MPVIRSMRPDDSIVIGDNIIIRAIKVGQERIKLVIDAPRTLPVVHRGRGAGPSPAPPASKEPEIPEAG